MQGGPLQRHWLRPHLNAATTDPDDEKVAVHNMVLKTDSLVDGQVRQGLKAAFKKLRAERETELDSQRKGDDVVQDLVDPSMYPFVYGKPHLGIVVFLRSFANDIIMVANTKFIQSEVVGVFDAVDHWSGKGEAVPKSESDPRVSRSQRPFDYGDSIARTYWSRTYQWLPANLEFQVDGTVRFTSYINNLHPKRHPEIYRLIQSLANLAIPVWERVRLNKPPVDDSGQPQERFGMPPIIPK